MSDTEPQGLRNKGFCEHGNNPAGCQLCAQRASQIEAPERSLEQRLDNVEKARRGVEQAVLLDAYLEKDGEHSLEDFLQSYRIEKNSVSEHLQERFSKVLSEWNGETETHAKIATWLEQITVEELGSYSPDNLGVVVLQGIVGKESVSAQGLMGHIQVEINGPFIVVYASSDEDYKKMHRADAGGSFHRAERTPLTYKNADLLPNILMVNGESGTTAAKETVEHERQHYINSKWMQKVSEVGADGQWTLATKEDWMKDEVLAYLKDGSEPERLNRLQDDLYKHLFENLQADETTKLRQNLSDIISTLSEADEFFPTKAARSLLVYHLIDIPLTRMPEVIKLLATYERQRGNPANTFNVPGKERVEINDGVIPPDPDDTTLPNLG
ncbi:TPA: hypothetical protein DEP96_03840 [Candidatus Uhrbacteria bacterium]|nr:hypothetical protein [Candidatus Uhrbacteria bacterium]